MVAKFLSPENAARLNNIGGVSELENIIRAASDMPCATCRSSVILDLQGRPVFGARRMDMMLDDLFEIGQQFAGKPDFIAIIKAGLKNGNANVREGTMHMMSAFRKDPEIFNAQNIKRIDAVFDEVPNDPCSACKFDVEMEDGNVVKFYEFKSYAPESIVNLNHQLKQFKKYLASVNDWNEFKYIFNKLKTHDIDMVKKEFQKFMVKNAEDLWANLHIRSLLQKFKGVDGSPIEEIGDFVRIVNHPEFYRQLTFVDIF